MATNTRFLHAAGCIIVFEFDYRGAREQWSQGYHVDGDFVDLANFLAFIAAIAASLKTCVSSETSIVKAYGYNSGDTVARFSTSTSDASGLPVSGTLSTSGGNAAPGDVATWNRWKTARMTTKGKPIYLRNYFHDVWVNSGSGLEDDVLSAQRTAIATFAATFRDTGFDGKKVAGPDGVIPGVNNTAVYATTRTLKRRGRRPPPP